MGMTKLFSHSHWYSTSSRRWRWGFPTFKKSERWGGDVRYICPLHCFAILRCQVYFQVVCPQTRGRDDDDVLTSRIKNAHFPEILPVVTKIGSTRERLDGRNKQVQNTIRASQYLYT